MVDWCFGLCVSVLIDKATKNLLFIFITWTYLSVSTRGRHCPEGQIRIAAFSEAAARPCNSSPQWSHYAQNSPISRSRSRRAICRLGGPAHHCGGLRTDCRVQAPSRRRRTPWAGSSASILRLGLKRTGERWLPKRLSTWPQRSAPTIDMSHETWPLSDVQGILRALEDQGALTFRTGLYGKSDARRRRPWPVASTAHCALLDRTRALHSVSLVKRNSDLA